jgi:hypothetical protein
LIGFVVLQIVCQLALLVPALAGTRVVVRIVPFASSLALLVFVPARGPRHRAASWALAVLAILCVQAFHPDSYSIFVSVAHTILYLAILAPLFWVPRLHLTARAFYVMILVLWGFHTLSVAFGILQVYYPGRFQPPVSSTILAMGEMADGLKVRLASGVEVWRPMGLTDSPGGACTAGLYAFLFGLGFLLNARGGLRAAGLASMLMGVFCIYLCQVRSVLVMALVCGIVLAVVLSQRGDVSRTLIIAVGVPMVFVVTFLWAAGVGGDSVSSRFSTLQNDRLDHVYYKSRGLFLEHTVYELLPQYPLGAGLGRWGMMDYYFGNYQVDRPEQIWVEIQWTGWLLDGGVPLILAYSGAVGLALFGAWRLASGRVADALARWAALVLAYDVAAVAVTFSYPLFIGQGGMEFWLLNAVLFAAGVQAQRAAWATRRAQETGQSRVWRPVGPLALVQP